MKISREHPPRLVWHKREVAAREEGAAAHEGDHGGGLQDGEADSHVARVLRERRLTRLPVFVELLELGNHDAEELHDNRRRNVRHHAEREDGHLQQRPAGEQVHHAEHAATGTVQSLFGTRSDVRVVEAGGRHEHAEAVDSEHSKDKQQLVPELRGSEGAHEGVVHQVPPVGRPEGWAYHAHGAH